MAPMLAPGDALTQGSLLEGRYRIDRVVGAGGFGVVHAGWHLVLDCPVAIKVLALSDADLADHAGRFLDEARVLSRLRHPHIVRVLDAGVTEPAEGARLSAWLVMEWCGDRTLADELRARPGARRSPTEVWRLMRPLVDAVASAHGAGVVHRDIKPSNIMMIDDGSTTPAARLIDFGIAKRVGSGRGQSVGHTATSGVRAYTPAYAAPEQLAGTRSGPWTDVHALALVLTEMLVGRRAYGETVDAGAIVDPLRPTPAALGADVGAWEPVLGRALALRSDKRYPDAGALRDALDEALERALPATTGAPAAPASVPSNASASAETRPDSVEPERRAASVDTLLDSQTSAALAPSTPAPAPSPAPEVAPPAPLPSPRPRHVAAALALLAVLVSLGAALRRDAAFPRTSASSTGSTATDETSASATTASPVASLALPSAAALPTSLAPTISLAPVPPLTAHRSGVPGNAPTARPRPAPSPDPSVAPIPALAPTPPVSAPPTLY